MLQAATYSECRCSLVTRELRWSRRSITNEDSKSRTKMNLTRRLSPAGYQQWHEAKDRVSTGETLGIRQRNLVEETGTITLNGKCTRRYQGGGLDRSTDDRYAVKHITREGSRP